jgi:hypothetical protein
MKTLLVGKVFLYSLPNKKEFKQDDQVFMNRMLNEISGAKEVQHILAGQGSYAITIEVLDTNLNDEEIINKIDTIADEIGYKR